MLTICCVNAGNYLGRGDAYVSALKTQVEQHVTPPFQFRVLDDPRLPKSWFAKLWLFKPNTFEPGTRVLYMDLDTLILANIDDLADYDGGLAVLGCPRDHRLFMSGVMAWEAGQYDFIWERWDRSGRPYRANGDQEFIEECVPAALRLQSQYSGILSYKFHKCKEAPPKGARVIYFSNRPKPHDCGGWAETYWQQAARGICNASQYPG